MARELVNFAGGGAVVADNRFDPELSEEITQYIEKESDFRQFIKTVKVNTYYVTLPRKWAAGIAVEIVEGSEIPKARDVFDQLSFNLRQIGTGIKMTDEEQQMMAFDSNYFQTEARRANERLLKKENNDIRLCMMSGAGYNIVTTNSNTGFPLTYNDIIDVKTLMRENPYGGEPDMILMSERTYADLVKSDDFKVYERSGIPGVIQDGHFGEYVAGLKIQIIRELEDIVFIIDSSKEPIVLVTMNGVHTEKYRLPETREDVLDLTYWEKPMIVRPDAIAKITITRPSDEVNSRKDYGSFTSSNPVDNDAIMNETVVSMGWDPVDGYSLIDSANNINYPGEGKKFTKPDGTERDYETGDPVQPDDSPRFGGDEEDSPSDGG